MFPLNYFNLSDEVSTIRVSDEVSTIRVSEWNKEASLNSHPVSLTHPLKRMVLTQNITRI